MRVVGLTGGIGSGKSQVGRLLSSLGYPYLDADLLAREILERPENVEELRRRFGSTVVAQSGRIDRVALGAMVFSDDARRSELEAFLHPMIQQLADQLFSPFKNSRFDVWCFYEAALLVEKNRVDHFDKVAVVTADWSVRQPRLAQRGVSSEAAQRVCAVQMPDEAKVSRVHYQISNNGTLKDLENEVFAFLKWLSVEFSHQKN